MGRGRSDSQKRMEYLKSPGELVHKHIQLFYNEGASGWYSGKVVEYNRGLEEMTIVFTDGAQENVRLADWEWRLCAPPRSVSKPSSRGTGALTRRELNIPAPPELHCASEEERPRGERLGKPASDKPSTREDRGGPLEASTVPWEWCGPMIRTTDRQIRYEAFARGELKLCSGDFVIVGDDGSIGRVLGGLTGPDGLKQFEYQEYIQASKTIFAAEKPNAELFLVVKGDEQTEIPVVARGQLKHILTRVSVEYVPAGAPAPTGLTPGSYFCRHSYNTERRRVTGMQ